MGRFWLDEKSMLPKMLPSTDSIGEFSSVSSRLFRPCTANVCGDATRLTCFGELLLRSGRALALVLLLLWEEDWAPGLEGV